MATSKTVISKKIDNQKYIYLRKYDRYHQNCNGKPMFSTNASVSVDKCLQQRPTTKNSDVAAKTENKSDSIEIPTANLRSYF